MSQMRLQKSGRDIVSIWFSKPMQKLKDFGLLVVSWFDNFPDRFLLGFLLKSSINRYIYRCL